MHDKLFTSMSIDARRFYSKVFNRVLLNLHAVRTGLFDTLFCETDDPRVMLRWNAALPNIINSMQERARRRDDDNETEHGV